MARIDSLLSIVVREDRDARAVANDLESLALHAGKA
jgi:hypothetical protein